MADTDVALRLPHLLGYKEAGSVIPDSVWLLNFEANETMLKKFLEVGFGVIELMKEDPASHVVASDVGSVPELAVQIAYHFRIIIELLCSHTYQHILPSLSDRVTHSLEFIQNAAQQLEIMSCDTDCYLLFECMKTDLLTYIETADEALKRSNLQTDIDEVGQLLTVELNSILPYELVYFMSYLSNLGGLLRTVLWGQMINIESASTYCTVMESVPTDSLSSEYMSVSDEVQALVLKSVTNPLEVQELSRLHKLCIWQAENFLTHFRPEVFDVTGYSEQLTAIAERNHLCLYFGCDKSGQKPIKTNGQQPVEETDLQANGHIAVVIAGQQCSHLMELLEQGKYDDLYTGCLASVTVQSSCFQVLRSRLEQLLLKQESMLTAIQQDVDELGRSLKMVKSSVVVRTLEGAKEQKLIQMEDVSRTLHKLKQILQHLGRNRDERKKNDFDDLTLLNILKRIASDAKSDHHRLLELLSSTSSYH